MSEYWDNQAALLRAQITETEAVLKNLSEDDNRRDNEEKYLEYLEKKLTRLEAEEEDE